MPQRPVGRSAHPLFRVAIQRHVALVRSAARLPLPGEDLAAETQQKRLWLALALVFLVLLVEAYR
jgi:hypothetical protein